MLGPLHLYHVVIIIVAIFSILFIYNRLRYKKSTPATFVLFCVVWVFVLVMTFVPDVSTLIAMKFGMGRGLDFISVVGLIICFYLIFKLYIRIEDNEQQMDKLIRQLAIDNEITLDDEDEE